MNEESGKFRHRHEEQEQTHVASGQQQAVHEFATAEELIRHDAAQTEVPAAIAEKVRTSLQKEAPPKPWWKRVFNR